MADDTIIHRDRRSANPIFNSRKLKLGTFQTNLDYGCLMHLKELFIAGWGAYPLTGTKEQVVEGLQTMSAMGLDGALLSWPRFEDGMREFKDVTYPLLVQAGLR
ncbi:MAG: hypothetical protein ABSA68_10430 [Xanthobacteraceae bacterium]